MALLLSLPSAFATEMFCDSTMRLPEISVTAVKSISKKENHAISSYNLSRTDIENRNIVTQKDVSIVVPNLYIPDYGSRVTSSIYVRGIGARIDQPVIGLNIDNIPVINKDNYDFDILDIDKMEVMRGPQSTLYGRNTMGGVINIKTLSPLSYKGSRVLLEYAKANSVKAGVSSYSMLSDKFGIGGNVSYSHTDGFFTNSYNNEKCDKENALRASLKLSWIPSSEVTIENAANLSITRQGGYAYEFADTKEINYNDTCFYRRNSIIDGLTAKWVHGKFSLTSITSYQYIDDNMTLDQDFLPVSYFTLTQKRKEHAVTQDVIIRSENESKIKWLGGLFGFYKHSETQAPVTFKDYGIENLITSNWNEYIPEYPMHWDSDSFVLGSKFSIPGFGLAAYGEASAELGHFTLTAGLRFDFEKSTLRYNSDCSTSYSLFDSNGNFFRKDPVEIHNYGELSRSFNQLLPSFSITYALPGKESHLYATAAKGYKAGGFNTQMFSDVLQQELMHMIGIGRVYDINDVVGYKPEKSWNYEIGGKFNFADNRISTEFSLFYIDCRDQQLTIFPDGTTTGRIMANAGKTESKGVELSITATPIKQLQLQASYGYTNAVFKEFYNGRNDYSGKFVPYAPQNTIFASANYTIMLKNGFLKAISFDTGITGAGKIYWNEENTASQDLYVLLNGGIKLSGEKFSLNLWTKNATSTQYSTFYFVSIQHEFLQKGKPAQFGATLRINI